MRKIIPEIFTKKLLSLFVENKKKTYNLKQVRFFINSVVDIKTLRIILYDFTKQNYLVNTGNDKFKFNIKFKLLKGRIQRRALVDLETGVEFKPRRSELKGVFDREIVYYFIDKKSNVRIFCHANREEIRYVGKVFFKENSCYVKIPKKDFKIIIEKKDIILKT